MLDLEENLITLLYIYSPLLNNNEEIKEKGLDLFEDENQNKVEYHEPCYFSREIQIGRAHV